MSRVLVFAPTGRDQALILRLLEKHGVSCSGCTSPDELLRTLRSGDSGPIILAEEALPASHMEEVGRLVDDQPDWSAVPVLLLTRGMNGHGRAELLRGRRGVRLLLRPLESRNLLVLVRIAVEARRRQGEVKRLLEALNDANLRLTERTGQLRQLSQTLMETEDRERRHLADLLHDDLQQLMAGARLRMEAAGRHIGDNEALREVWTDVRDALAEAQGKCRDLSHDLIPSELMHAELPQMLEWIGREAKGIFGLDVDVRIESEIGDVTTSVVRFVYRAVREMLCNAVKHAEADQARIEAGADEGRIWVVVSDRGNGFDPARLEKHDADCGVGLMYIRERIEWLGGRLHIESRIGEGSRFEMSLPAIDGHQH